MSSLNSAVTAQWSNISDRSGMKLSLFHICRTKLVVFDRFGIPENFWIFRPSMLISSSNVSYNIINIYICTYEYLLCLNKYVHIYHI